MSQHLEPPPNAKWDANWNADWNANGTTNWDAIIIGGGAAGFFTAITLAQQAPKARVLLLEGSSRLLAKVAISGGGRCNVTHACFDAQQLLLAYPRAHKQLVHNFKRFGPRQVVTWFESRGVALKTEPDGRMFPVSDDSQSVLVCLLQQAQTLGVVIKKTCRVSAVQQTSAGFRLTVSAGTPNAPNSPNAPNTATKALDGQTLNTRALVLATGGVRPRYQQVSLAEQLGHQMIDGVPSLFTFCVNDDALTALAGVSVPRVGGRLTVSPEAVTPAFADAFTALPAAAFAQQTGPLLVTHWGLSGPCVLKLSAWGARALAYAGYRATLWLDWLPDAQHEAFRQTCLAAKQRHGARQLKNAQELLGATALPRRLWLYLLQHASLTDVCPGLTEDTPLGDLKDKTLNRFSERLKRWPVQIQGKGVFKEEFVTAGGVPLNEVHLARYESKRCPGLYVVGELLDVDGVTGGFNFQNAWTSGFLAGCHLAERFASARPNGDMARPL
ncbi:MAG: aminoacetone oxidase family FAD-binding enzyme [Vampirovibrionales bacterium]|nr:aminoacetone oxidase family FAD-binding enzyme [Vampirovibrionales bacterium]